MEHALAYYAKTGFIDIQSRNQEPGIKHNIKPRRDVGINDCLFRNMHAYKWIMIIDSDEFIIPQNSKTLLEMISSFEEELGADDIDEISFNNTNYFIDFPGNKLRDETLLTMNVLYHKAPEIKPRRKPILKSKRCILTSPHFCKRPFQSYKRIAADVSIGKNHHYKRCDTARQHYVCNFTGDYYFYDNKILRYKEQLEEAVMKIP